MPIPRLDRIERLLDADFLAELCGPHRGVSRRPMAAPGFSGATFERIALALEGGAERTLVLKVLWPAADWTSRLTGDSYGREAHVIEARALTPVWEVYATPYVAIAREGERLALLMEDLGPHLLPDVREPLSPATEARLVEQLARLHARFWNRTDGLRELTCDAASLAGLLLPARAREEHARDPGSALFERVASGWKIAEANLAPDAWQLVCDVPERFAALSAGLPVTLLHGDSKVANFAPLPDGRVAAFDWALLARGPAALEIGYSLAVNASRLSGTRAEWLVLYRARLEAALGTALPADEWRRTENLSVLCGAALMLWAKAHWLAGGSASGAAEWRWYADELVRLAREWS